MEVTFPDEVIEQLADAVEKRLAKRKIKIAQKPLSVTEFSKATGLSRGTIYLRVEAGTIRTVDDHKPILIPAAELDRFQ